jgi:hypothetical protein
VSWKNVRDTADFDVDRASPSTCFPTGSCARRHWRVETPASIPVQHDAFRLVAVGEMVVGRGRH